MFLKPKTTVFNEPAVLYRRFISIESSTSLTNIYKTIDNKIWSFDYISLEFKEITEELNTIPQIQIVASNDLIKYNNTYFYYTTEWVKSDTIIENMDLLSAFYNNIGQYQMNKYYARGSFDYMINGEQSNSTVQFVKGLIAPLNTLNIKYFNDDINLKEDDLVVIDKRLYSVENPTRTMKNMPRPYYIYYATLNSIL